jgi:hypothetical protein
MKILTTISLSSLALCLAAVPYGARSQTLAYADSTTPPATSTKTITLVSTPPTIDASIQGLLDGSSVLDMKGMNATPTGQTELSRMGCARSGFGWNKQGCQGAFNRARHLQARPAVAPPAFQQDVQAFRTASVNADDVTLGLPKRQAGPVKLAALEPGPSPVPPVPPAVADIRFIPVKRGPDEALARAEARAAVVLPVRRMVEYDYTAPALSPAAFGLTLGGNADTVTAGGLLKLDGPTLGWGGTRIGALAMGELEFAPGATRASLDSYLTLSKPLWNGFGLLVGAGPSFGGGKGGFGAGGGLLGGVFYDINPGWSALAYGKVTAQRYDDAWQSRSVFGLALTRSLPN